MQFLQELIKYDFLQRSLLAALLVSIPCGILGAYSIVRRNSYMIGAISHSLLGGIGLARYLAVCTGLSFITPLWGALFSAVLSAIIVTCLSSMKKLRTDTILSAIWTVSTAIGLCLVAAIPGYAEDLNSYLFGSILLITDSDLYFMLAMDLIILLATWAFRTRFIAFCFHKEGLTLRGLSVFRNELLLNLLSAIAIVLMVKVVGIILALALFILPASAAANYCRKLNSIMVLGGLICFISTVAGIAISYAPEWHTGAIIIIITAIIYGISNIKSSLKNLFLTTNKH